MRSTSIIYLYTCKSSILVYIYIYIYIYIRIYIYIYSYIYTVAAIESVDKIIKISLLVIKIEYNRNTYKKQTSDGNYPVVYKTYKQI